MKNTIFGQNIFDSLIIINEKFGILKICLQVSWSFENLAKNLEKVILVHGDWEVGGLAEPREANKNIIIAGDKSKSICKFFEIFHKL